ncbi:VirB4 family type IV secretion system protein [Hymenobacter jeollabukensis]|uniref:Type IV secretion system protein VirB4 n=1 Tax=Hymenobacter jeollabukensis TaxID=2025313 RepID=A0A5R8WJ40_9BACT|nr:type IV secretion system protein VirB4 [Hymenobacter jeollabukensis]TLM88795.1 type IV secretion system protein VirB4 [Hymenobacter jeollabukensis]
MKKVKSAPLTGANPVFKFEDDKVILKDGRVSIGFRLHAAEMEQWDGDAYSASHAAFIAALKSLPVGAVFQKTDVYYDKPYQHQMREGAYFNNRMGRFFGERLVLYHQSYVFLSFAAAPTSDAKKAKAPRRTNALNALVNRAGDLLGENRFATVVKSMELAERAASEFKETLRAVPGVTLERLNEQEVQQLYLQYFNLEFADQPKHLAREMVNEIGTLAVGERKVSAVSMVGQGTEVHPWVHNDSKVVTPMLFPMTHYLQFPHILTQAVLVHDTKDKLDELDRDRKLNSSLSSLATQDNLLRVAEIEELSLDVRNGNKQLVDLHLSCLVWDTDDVRRQNNLEKASAALRGMYDSEAVVESFLTLPLFFGALPGNAFQIPDRWIPLSSDRASCYVHWTTTYRPERSGEYICDRFRNLVRVNLFDTTQNNQNSITIGPSGSGKSYTMGNFIIQRFESGARQIIIDVGGSYRNVVQSLTGADFENCYFTYDPANPIEFNPFFVPRNSDGRWLYNEAVNERGEEISNKKNFHLALLATLWKHTKDTVLQKAEQTILSRFLDGYYAHLNEQPNLGKEGEAFPGLEGFYRYVQATHEAMMQLSAEDEGLATRQRQYQKDITFVNMNEFFLVLSDYVTGGRYAKVLNAKRDRDLSDYPLICFDMDKVKADATLYPVVAMLITELSLDLFFKYKKDVKYILMDEAWSMLSGSLQDFIENMYRTIRKTNGSIGIITQGIDEIVKSPIGKTLITNSATKIILLHQSEAEWNQLAAPLGFTPHEMSLIASMRSGGTYREFFIKKGSNAKVFVLEAAPQMNAILSSKPYERNYLNDLVKQYQFARPVPQRDANGKQKRDPQNGELLYDLVFENQLPVAVDVFVEDLQAGKVHP